MSVNSPKHRLETFKKWITTVQIQKPKKNK